MNKLVILIPHYNSPEDIEKTIASISENFSIDILVVDDGSKNAPDLNKLTSIYNNSGSIFLEKLQTNQGIEKALNYGLRFIENKEYQYIGRLDSGDTAITNKFEKQLDYLNQNPEVFLLGTWGNIINSNNEQLYVLKHPESYTEIKRRMFYNSCFIHPSVVFRKEILQSVGYYPENRKAAEDYAYFFKIIKKHKSENLPEALINYVIDENSISSVKRKQQIRSRIKVILDNFYLGFYPVMGLLRNSILLFTSRNLILKIKLLLKIEK